MARPRKIGLDYFPLDTVFDSDVEMLEEEFGNDGLSVLIKTWQALYRTKDGFINCDATAMQKIMAGRSRISPRRWNDIITFAAKLGLFDAQQWREKIIFSSGVALRLRKVFFERNPDVENKQVKVGFPEINLDNSSGFVPDNSKISAETKENKKKVNKSNTQTNRPESVEEVKAYWREYRPTESESQAVKFWNHYQAKGWVDGNGNPIKNWKALAATWQSTGRKK